MPSLQPILKLLKLGMNNLRLFLLWDFFTLEYLKRVAHSVTCVALSHALHPNTKSHTVYYNGLSVWIQAELVARSVLSNQTWHHILLIKLMVDTIADNRKQRLFERQFVRGLSPLWWLFVLARLPAISVLVLIRRCLLYRLFTQPGDNFTDVWHTYCDDVPLLCLHSLNSTIGLQSDCAASPAP